MTSSSRRQFVLASDISICVLVKRKSFSCEMQMLPYVVLTNTNLDFPVSQANQHSGGSNYNFINIDLKHHYPTAQSFNGCKIRPEIMSSVIFFLNIRKI